MKSKSIINSIVLLLGAGLILLNSCKKETYDCDGPILDFKMEMQGFIADSLLECTKCIEGGSIKFSMIDPTAEVIRWKVGNDPREFTERSFSLFFENALGRQFPVTLYMEKYIENENCERTYFRDSITKILEFVSYYDSQIFGRYKGHNIDEPNKEFVVEIIDSIRITNISEAQRCLPFVNPPIYKGVIKGIPSTCHGLEYVCHYPRPLVEYDKFYFDSNGYTDECLSAHGRGELDENDPNKITIGYKTFVDIIDGERIEKERKFIGYRIN